jgi:hypothetical protein
VSLASNLHGCNGHSDDHVVDAEWRRGKRSAKQGRTHPLLECRERYVGSSFLINSLIPALRDRAPRR